MSVSLNPIKNINTVDLCIQTIDQAVCTSSSAPSKWERPVSRGRQASVGTGSPTQSSFTNSLKLRKETLTSLVSQPCQLAPIRAVTAQEWAALCAVAHDTEPERAVQSATSSVSGAGDGMIDRLQDSLSALWEPKPSSK